MKHSYAYLQWSGWGLLYVFYSLVIFNRPVFVDTELLYAAVLIGATGLGSHFLRTLYRRYAAQGSLLRQVGMLLGGCLLFAALATSILLLTFFTLTIIGYTFPVPADQRWFIIKTIFVGNYFNMLLALLLWSAIYFAITKVRQLRQTTALLHATQLDALISQLNPHFLFNAINNIRALILEDPERARNMLAALSDMLRYNLKPEDGIKVPLKEELDIVHHYLALCSIQFEQRLQYQQQIAPGCAELLVPKLLLQLCVENAIKHGISHLPQGGQVTISAELKADKLQLRVSNHGCLQKAGSSTAAGSNSNAGLGLKNIRQRLQLLYQGQASLQLYQQQEQVITDIRLPMEREDEGTDH
ncbi:sensor histidine kinase [Arsukibacterium sp.]|uniref:sensor histidine kinase n=1 Tax=Arsukibacterium sp. TaxID=1977258 RepID=UPI002FDAA3E3